MRRNTIKISPGIGNYYFCFEFVNELLFTEKLYQTMEGVFYPTKHLQVSFSLDYYLWQQWFIT